MRFVAEYVMRGRWQALWVSVLCASSLLFSWLGAAVLALVTLRRGAGEGAYILAWAVLPAGFLLAVFGDIGSFGMIVGSTALAALLHWTRSWQMTLLGACLLGIITGLLMLTLGLSLLEQSASEIAEWIANAERWLARNGSDLILPPAPSAVAIAGMLGLVNAMSCVACLLLARWWQAALYNPGGFRREFHQLRYSPIISLGLALALLLISGWGPDSRPWAMLFAIPLSLAGMGLLHARVAYNENATTWLTIFYLLWLLLDPIKLGVIGFAVLDSFVDFRSRWPREKGQDHDTDS